MPDAVANRSSPPVSSAAGGIHCPPAFLGVALALQARRHRLPLRPRELDLPQADALRRHLDALVVADELQRLLERERARRNETDELVRGRRAHVRQLLLLGGVDVEILAPGVLA